MKNRDLLTLQNTEESQKNCFHFPNIYIHTPIPLLNKKIAELRYQGRVKAVKKIRERQFDRGQATVMRNYPVSV